MKPLIVANWKANPSSLAEARRLFDFIQKGTRGARGVEIAVCPPFTYLSSFDTRASNLKLGAQDCFWAGGAFTGETSPEMLKNLGVEYVIVGHSERRRYLGETAGMVDKKLKAALKSGLKPILCVSDSSQLKGVKKEIIVAFEPLSAIGTGRPYSVEKAEKIREKISCPFVLYGGSVDSKNAAGYISQAGFQGLLIGGSSLDSKEFIEIVKAIC